MKLSKSNFIICCTSSRENYFGSIGGQNTSNNPKFEDRKSGFYKYTPTQNHRFNSKFNPWKHISLKINNIFLRNRKQKKNVERLNFLASVETDSDSDGVTDSQRTKSNLQSQKLHCCYFIPKIHNCFFDIYYKCSTHYLMPSTQLP